MPPDGEVFDAPGVDELYALEPSEFVDARNELAKRLRSDGDKEMAAAVKKLPRPTMVAWALNHVGRSRPDDVQELLALGERVREAQEQLLGGGEAGMLRDVTDARRRLVRDLANAAVELAGENHRTGIVATLDTASTDPAGGAALRAGRLVKALDPPSGFGLGGMPEPAAPAPAPAPKGPDRRVVQRLQRELDQRDSAAEQTEEALRRAEERRDQAQAAVDRAEAALDEARAAQQAAAAALDEVQG